MCSKYQGMYRILDYWAEKTPTKTAAFIENENISYKELKNISETIANALYHCGVRKGDRIGILYSNSVKWYCFFWGALKIGAVPVPFDPQLGLSEMTELFITTGIRVCFVQQQFRGINHLARISENFEKFYDLQLVISEESAELPAGFISYSDFINQYTFEPLTYDPQLHPDDPLMMVCTSGTTGKPKIIVVEHEGFIKSQEDMAHYLGFTEDVRMLLGMPLFHQGGFGMGIQVLSTGGTVMYQQQFTPYEFLDLISREKVNTVQLTSTLAKILLSALDQREYDLSALKMCYFAGEALPDELAEIFYISLGKRVINLMGSSETASMLVWDSDYDRDFPVNQFKSLPFTDVKVLNDQGDECCTDEIGVIHIHTDALLREYYKNEKDTSKQIKFYSGNKWFDTGDLGKKLSNGRLEFTGRLKRIIKRGANLIYPEEVETCLLTHPEIEAAAVIGEKDELFGQKSTAYLQIVKDSRLLSGDIITFCSKRLSAYKIPDTINFIDEIPKGIGKVQYRKIRKSGKG